MLNRYRIKYTHIGDGNYQSVSYGETLEEAVESFKTSFKDFDKHIRITNAEFVCIEPNLKRA